MSITKVSSQMRPSQLFSCDQIPCDRFAVQSQKNKQMIQSTICMMKITCVCRYVCVCVYVWRVCLGKHVWTCEHGCTPSCDIQWHIDPLISWRCEHMQIMIHVYTIPLNTHITTHTHKLSRRCYKSNLFLVASFILYNRRPKRGRPCQCSCWPVGS